MANKIETEQKVFLDLSQQHMRLASKVSSVIVLSSLLQEALSLNQQLVKQNAELLEDLQNERKRKSPEPDGEKVRGEAREDAR